MGMALAGKTSKSKVQLSRKSGLAAGQGDQAREITVQTSEDLTANEHE
jgi:hypothetical protein